MKKVFILSVFTLFLGLTSVFAQLPVNQKTKKVTFLEVVEAQGLSAAKIFEIAKEWAEGHGYSITEAKAGGKLVCAGKHAMTYTGKKKKEQGEVEFSFSVFCKEGKYRIIATDFKHAGVEKAASGGKLEARSAGCGSDKMTAATWLTVKKITKRETDKKIADLKRVIKEVANDPANNDDW